jgi:hypothetical protein
VGSLLHWLAGYRGREAPPLTIRIQEINMKHILVLLWFCLGLSNSGDAQTSSSPPPTLIETLLWMHTFSREHGVVLDNSRVHITNSFSAKGCAVEIETNFLTPRTKDAPTKRTVDLHLGELNSKLTLETTDDGSTDVDFQRADAQPKIHQLVEYPDGSQLEIWAGEDSIFFDTRTSAEKFSRTFTYAINLCAALPRSF